MAEWVLAIDFGTTSTAAAIRVGDAVDRIELDGSPRMPSMVFWHEGTGSSRTGRLVLGEEAEELSGLAPWCLERTPKRRIGDEFIRLGDKELRVVDVIGAILRRVADEALALRGGEPPREVRLTHPARWARPSLDKLGRAAEIAGFTSPMFVAEPVAAATHFASERLAPGEHVAVYDLGGGTLDTAVLLRTSSSFELVGAPGGNENLGGEDFDDRLYRYLGRQLSQEQWQLLRDSTDRVWMQANRELLRSARRTKEFLSRSPRYEFYMPPPIDQELVVSAETFRELIVEDVQSTAGELERTVRAAGLDPSELTAIYLAGGSSRIPLVARTIQQRLGQLPESWDDPKAVTVLGAARLAAAPATASTIVRRRVPEPTPDSSLVTEPPTDRAERVTEPARPEREPERRDERSGGGRRLAALGLLAVVALAGIGAGALAAAGVFSKTSTATTIVEKGRTTIVTTATSALGATPSGTPSGTKPCGGGLSVGANTSCAFAANVEHAYDQAGGGSQTVSAYSPATGLTYTINCTAGSPHVCTGGTTHNASIYFTSGPSGAPGSRSSVGTPPSSTTGLHACDQNVFVNAHTSCKFAENVFYEYTQSPRDPSGQVMTIFSPVTQNDYTVTCTPDQQGDVDCSSNTNSYTTFSQASVNAYTPSEAAAYASSADLGDSNPNG